MPRLLPRHLSLHCFFLPLSLRAEPKGEQPLQERMGEGGRRTGTHSQTTPHCSTMMVTVGHTHCTSTVAVLYSTQLVVLWQKGLPNKVLMVVDARERKREKGMVEQQVGGTAAGPAGLRAWCANTVTVCFRFCGYVAPPPPPPPPRSSLPSSRKAAAAAMWSDFHTPSSFFRRPFFCLSSMQPARVASNPMQRTLNQAPEKRKKEKKKARVVKL